MFTFHKVLLAKHANSLDEVFPKVFPYHVFRAAWYHYIELLEIDFNEAYKCPVCTSEPAIVICDATSLAFRCDFVAKTPQKEPSDEKVFDGW